MSTFKVPEGRWLIVGKGPSSADYRPSMALAYNVIAINQASQIRPLIACFNDYEPIVDSTPWLESVPYVWIQSHPHFRQTKASAHSELQWFMQHTPTLRYLHMWNRLYSYDLACHEITYIKEAPYFAGASTIETVVDILGRFGVRTIHTLGIDGGKLKSKDYESTYRTIDGDYSLQFNGLDLLAKKWGLNITAL